MFFTLFGCEKPSIFYIENPYFEDTSKNEILEVYEQKAIYDDKLVAYYNDTYATIEDLFNDGIDYDQSYQSRYSMDMSLIEVETLFESLMNP